MYLCVISYFTYSISPCIFSFLSTVSTASFLFFFCLCFIVRCTFHHFNPLLVFSLFLSVSSLFAILFIPLFPFILSFFTALALAAPSFLLHRPLSLCPLSVFTFPSVCSAIFTPAASALIYSSSWCMSASRRDLSLHSRCAVPLPQSNRLPSAWGHVHACTQRKLIPASHCSTCYGRLSHRKLEHSGARPSRSQSLPVRSPEMMRLSR